MSSYENQLKTVWQVVTIISKNKQVCGGGLCYREDGHLLTAYHVVETRDMNINVRKQDDTGFRKATFVKGIRSLDVAILRIIPSFDGEKFDFRAPHDNIELQVDDLLVTHGHGAGISFSSRFGNVAYPYQPSGDLAARLHNLDLTLGNSNEADLKEMRDECPPPQQLRTVGNVVAMREDKSFGELAHLHPFLPVIEQDEIGMKGFSGCPGFKNVDGKLVGMVIGGTNGYTFFVPNDVLNFVLQSLDMQ